MSRTYSVLRRATRRFFEGDSGTQQNDPNAGQTAPPPPTAPPPVAQPSKTYTEVEFNRLLNSKVAEEKRKLLDSNKKTVEQLQALQQSQQLTQQEKESLTVQIEELQATYRTVEETKKVEIDKLQAKYDKDVKLANTDRDSWKNRFETNMIDVDITNAAAKYDAVNPEQIRALLKPITRCQERLDDAGKPTGGYITRVKFEDQDQEGKPVALDLDTDAAVKLMRDRANRFGNLFKNSTNGGTGALINANPLGGGKLDLSAITDPAVYRKNREKIHQQMRAESANR